MAEVSVGDELVAQFDAAGNLVGACRRSVMRRDNLWHAASSIVVRGPADGVYLHRRTLSKDVFPGLLDFAAGGVVLADEDPAVGALRELDEEAPVRRAPISPEHRAQVLLVTKAVDPQQHLFHPKVLHPP